MTKIAIPTRDNVVDDHFGHCDHYTVFTIDNPSTGSGQAPNIISSERLNSPHGCGCKSNIASVSISMDGIKAFRDNVFRSESAIEMLNNMWKL